MKDDTKRWIDEIASSIYYLFDYEPWLSYKAIKNEVQGYYNCSCSDYKRAYKIANRKYETN